MPDPVIPPVRLKFWGVRGSVPAPGHATASIGGNTACVELRADGELIILDAGTGIRPLGLALDAEFKGAPLDLTLLLSHTHWDHIQGFPFFQPAYLAQNHLQVLGCPPPKRSLGEALCGQMESAYFPVPMAELSAQITIAEITTPGFSVGRVGIRAARVNHPGAALGYRLETSRGVIVYIPDCEPAGWNAEPASPRPDVDGSFTDATGPGLLEFVRGADILIFDSQYDHLEYAGRIGWGHACLDDTVDLAISANARRLYLFHHDPRHSDARVQQMLAGARHRAAVAGSPLQIEVAREGLEVSL